MNNTTTLGALKSVTNRNGTPIPSIYPADLIRFADYAKDNKLVFSGQKDTDDQNKRNLYQLYAYTGTKGEFSCSNCCFVDIDTTNGVDNIVNNPAPLFSAVTECTSIRFIQKSYSGKLHIVCNIPECRTIDEWTKEATYANLYVLQEIARIYGIDYTADGWDTHNLKFTQSLAISANPFVFNNNNEQKYFIPYKDRKNKFTQLDKPQPHHDQPTTPKEIIKGFGFGAWNVGYQGEQVTIDKNLCVGKYNGFALRWRVVNASYEIFGDDYRDFVKTYFANSFEILSSKPNATASKVVKNWLLQFFKITPTTPTLHPGEYLTKYESQIKDYITATPRAGLIAPTGAGKTTIIKKLAKDFNAVVICPYNSIISQYDGFTNLNTLRGKEQPLPNVVYVGTFDKALKYDFSDRLVIIDESHTLFTDGTYRDRLCYLLNNYTENKGQRLLCVSATPCKEFDLLGISQPMQFARERKHVQTFWEVIDGDTTIKETEIINTFITGKTAFDKIVVFDDFSAKKLYPLYKDNSALLATDCKFDKDFIFTIEKQQLPKRIIFSTKICFNGVSFKDKANILAVCRFTPGITTEQFITQCVGRFRNQDANVTLLVLESKMRSSAPIQTKIERASKANKINAEYGDFAKLIQKGIAENRYNDEIITKINLQIEQYQQTNATREKVVEGLKKRGYFDFVKIYCDANKERFKDKNRLNVSNSFKKQLSDGTAPEKLQYDKTLLFAREWQTELVNLTRTHTDGTTIYTKKFVQNYVATAMEKTTITTIIRSLRLMATTRTWTAKEFEKLADIYAKLLLLYPDTPANRTARQIMKGNFHKYKQAYEDSHRGEQMELFGERMEKCQHRRQARFHKLKLFFVANGKTIVFASKDDLRKFLINENYTERQIRFLFNNKKDGIFYISTLTKADEKLLNNQKFEQNGSTNKNPTRQDNQTDGVANFLSSLADAFELSQRDASQNDRAGLIRAETPPDGTGTATRTREQKEFFASLGGRNSTAPDTCVGEWCERSCVGEL